MIVVRFLVLIDGRNTIGEKRKGFFKTGHEFKLLLWGFNYSIKNIWFDFSDFLRTVTTNDLVDLTQSFSEFSIKVILNAVIASIAELFSNDCPFISKLVMKVKEALFIIKAPFILGMVDVNMRCVSKWLKTVPFLTLLSIDILDSVFLLQYESNVSPFGQSGSIKYTFQQPILLLSPKPFLCHFIYR